MIKILETKQVSLKFSDLEPGEVFIDYGHVYMAIYDEWGTDYKTLKLMDKSGNYGGYQYQYQYQYGDDEIITEIVTKYEYTHDKQ